MSHLRKCLRPGAAERIARRLATLHRGRGHGAGPLLGQSRANNAIISLGFLGDLSVYLGQGAGTADVVINVSGYFQ